MTTKEKLSKAVDLLKSIDKRTIKHKDTFHRMYLQLDAFLFDEEKKNPEYAVFFIYDWLDMPGSYDIYCNVCTKKEMRRFKNPEFVTEQTATVIFVGKL